MNKWLEGVVTNWDKLAAKAESGGESADDEEEADVKAADPGKDDAGGEGGNDAAVASTAGDYAAADDALFNLLNG